MFRRRGLENQTIITSVARWPKFRQKSSKGAGKKKSWQDEFMANLRRIYQKWQKRGRGKCSIEILLSWTQHWGFCEIGRTFLMYWPESNFGTWQHWSSPRQTPCRVLKRERLPSQSGSRQNNSSLWCMENYTDGQLRLTYCTSSAQIWGMLVYTMSW